MSRTPHTPASELWNCELSCLILGFISILSLIEIGAEIRAEFGVDAGVAIGTAFAAWIGIMVYLRCVRFAAEALATTSLLATRFGLTLTGY
jgi:hypothetical protein